MGRKWWLKRWDTSPVRRFRLGRGWCGDWTRSRSSCGALVLQELREARLDLGHLLFDNLQATAVSRRSRQSTYSSTLVPLDLRGPSKVHDCLLALHRLQGGFSLPIHFIFIRWQKSCMSVVVDREFTTYTGT